MKDRMTALDVRAEVADLQRSIVGMRCSNVYDFQVRKIWRQFDTVIVYRHVLPDLPQDNKRRMYMLKLFRADQPKLFLILESGRRIHCTQYAREKPTVPSGFSMKLRKHIRTKRVESINQLNHDRVVDIQFGFGEAAYHLILELYASGNLVLADHEYNILALLRTHRYDEEVRVAVKEKYPINVAANVGQNSEKSTESSSDTDDAEGQLHAAIDALHLREWLVDKVQEGGGDDQCSFERAAAKKRKTTLKTVLSSKGSGLEMLGPVLIEHSLLSAGLKPNQKLPPTQKDLHPSGLTEEEADRLKKALKDSCAILRAIGTGASGRTLENDISSSTRESKKEGGYIMLRSSLKKASTTTEAQPAEVGAEAGTCETEPIYYQDFTPCLLAQHQDKKFIAFPSYDETVDEYFSKIESHEAALMQEQAKSSAEAKVEWVRNDQQARIDSLETQQEKLRLQAELLEIHQTEVDQAISVIRSALDHGVDWTELEELVATEQENGNPVANLIYSLQLDRQAVTLVLEDDSLDGDAPAVLVEVDVYLSALANAREIHTTRKKAGQKAAKTRVAAEEAVKRAEKKAMAALEKKQRQVPIHHMRKTYWFEKFHWFITSENYLVLAGRDAQQNEQLVKRYLRKGDAYIHADLHGAASCILRNSSDDPDAPLSSIALEEAAAMTVCRSAAWSASMVTSAWWVHAHQVSKTAPSGEYLTTGSFMIRGKKNFLSPVRLEMGFAMLFKLDDSCIAAHIHERRRRDLRDSDGGELQIRRVTELVTDTKTSMVDETDEFFGSEKHSPGVGSEVDDEQGRAIGKEEGEEEEYEGTRSRCSDSDIRGKSGGLPGMSQHQNVEESDDDIASAEGEDSTSNEAKASGNVDVQAKEKLAGMDTSEDVSCSPHKKGKGSKDKKNKVDQDHNRGTGSAPHEAKGGKKLPRGKKGKLKKMKQKYAEQDDEERSLRMAALGNALPSSNRKKGVDAGLAEGMGTGSQEEEAGSSSRDAPHETPRGGRNAPSGYPSGPLAAPNRPTRAEKKAERHREEEEIQKIMEEEKLVQLPDGVKVDFLHSLTGLPTDNDVIQFALPVCAPYSVVRGYKFCMKLTPGPMKKGKAAKQAMDSFLRGSKINDVEKSLLRSIPEASLIDAMMGGVRLAGAGLQASKKGGQKAKKGKKKR